MRLLLTLNRQAVMKEAMRMHPGVAFPLERVVPSGGMVICDKHLPAGTIVGINPAVIHYNTDIFGADADKFRPERWLDEDKERVKMMDRHDLAVSLPPQILNNVK
jgi:cytochrome P450